MDNISPVVTRDESRDLDRWAMDQGVPFLSLMEVAGAKAATSLLTKLTMSRVYILVGTGANGGDGLVVARHLARKMPVTVALADGVPRFSGAESLLAAAKAFGAEVVSGSKAHECIQRADVVVDALYGTGFHGTLEESVAFPLINEISRQELPVFALDILSGVSADSGYYDGPPLQVVETLTFGAPKWGHFGQPGAELLGCLRILDIGLKVPESVGGRWMSAALASSLIPTVQPFANKFHKGRVMVVGGSPAMPGAPLMASWAALKSGAGLVDLMAPKSLVTRVKAPAPLMVWPAGESADGFLRLTDKDVDHLKHADAIVFGPGLGRAVPPGTLGRVLALGIPTVIDADGLNMLAGFPTPLSEHTILTPHAGEAGRLLGTSSREVERDRRTALIEISKRYHAHVLLKGGYTLSGNGRRISVNTSGGPELATAGSGDVLAGIIAAFLGQSLIPEDAMALGAYLHGWAGYHAKARNDRAVTATDMIEHIGDAWRSIREGQPAERAPREF